MPGPDVDYYSPGGIYRFSFPKTPEAVAAMEREIALLRAIPHLPLSRWHPTESSRDTRAAGHTFMGGLSEPPGEPLTPAVLESLRGTKRWEQFAMLLARCLHGIHATPLDKVFIPLPPIEGRGHWERIYTEIQARFFDYLPRDARQRIADRFEPFLNEPGNWTWATTIVHGDFAPHNIRYCIYSDGSASLSGIAGWHRIGLGDPAADLASLLGRDAYGEEFINRFADAYPGLEEELPRARFYASARPLRAALATPPGEERQVAARLLASDVL